MVLATSSSPPHILSSFLVSSRFLARPQLLTRYAPLPLEGHPSDMFTSTPWLTASRTFHIRLCRSAGSHPFTYKDSVRMANNRYLGGQASDDEVLEAQPTDLSGPEHTGRGPGRPAVDLCPAP